MTPEDVLKKYWGYDNFRPLQLDIIHSVMDGRDTLGLMPTGGGKSITFQVPALLLPGITIVVTPLISLMKDQVDNLRQRGIKAATLFSGMARRERTLACDRARLGKIKLLYVSPERLRSESFRTEMRAWNISLIVVDEAHCISQWGFDFRPSYLRIATLRDIFPDAPVLALTASATPIVQNDIIENLKFRHGFNRYALSYHRNNLSYVVRIEEDKYSKLVASLTAVQGCAIVYVRSRRATAKIADMLNEAGISATFYHAGLEASVKEQRQQDWKDGRVRVIVATNAFGMGIDKPDVRVVVHMDIPPSLEEYYQEAGRAGRDGLQSYALMIASKHDKGTLTRRLNAAYPPKDYILKVYEKACVFMDIPVDEGYGHVYEFDINKFCRTFRLDPDWVHGALMILSNAGYFDYDDDPTTRAKVNVLIRRDDFYHIDLTQPEADVVNVLFRLYPGLFADYVNIDEDTIAVTASLDRQTVYEVLLSLARKKIIHYIPKRVLPYIYMPTAREDTRYITIPRSVYEDRRTLMEQRINAMRTFVFGAETCRDKVLLEYFGETDASDCGMCDICKRRERVERENTMDSRTSGKEFGRLTSHIVNTVNAHPGVTIDSFLIAMPEREEAFLEAVRYLLANKELIRRANRLYPTQTKPQE